MGVVVRLRAVGGTRGPKQIAADDTSSPVPAPPTPYDASDKVGMELGLARPCDECTKVICALGCFRRIVYSTADGCLASIAPEELLRQCTPSSGKRQQNRERCQAQQNNTTVPAERNPRGGRASRAARRGR